MPETRIYHTDPSKSCIAAPALQAYSTFFPFYIQQECTTSLATTECLSDEFVAGVTLLQLHHVLLLLLLQAHQQMMQLLLMSRYKALLAIAR
jgi:hypothetical protein